jgi:hypothetical protein
VKRKNLLLAHDVEQNQIELLYGSYLVGCSKHSSHNSTAGSRLIMDEREFEFVSELLEEYNCGICQSVMIKPVCCREGHSWCESCIGQWLHNHDTCPMGGDQLTVAQLNKLRPLEQVCYTHQRWSAKLHVQ